MINLAGVTITGGVLISCNNPTYSISANVGSVNEGDTVSFTVSANNLPNGTVLYWTTSGNVSTGDFGDSTTSGSVTMTNGTGNIVRTMSADQLVDGVEYFNLNVRSGSVAGTILATSPAVIVNDISLPAVQTALFAMGYKDSGITQNGWTVSSAGVISSMNTSFMATGRSSVCATTYGGDKGLYAYGTTSFNNYSSSINYFNLVTNGAVVGTDAASAGTARWAATGVGYGSIYGIIMFGQTAAGPTVSTTNLVSDTGVIGTDSSSLGTAGYFSAATTYGSGRATVVFGSSRGVIQNLISNTGVVAADNSTTGTTNRDGVVGTAYGGDKGILLWGGNTYNVMMTNKVSNTGVVAADVSQTCAGGVVYPAQKGAATTYGGDKCVHHGGFQGAGYSYWHRFFNNLGNVASNTSSGLTYQRAYHAGVSVGY